MLTVDHELLTSLEDYNYYYYYLLVIVTVNFKALLSSSAQCTFHERCQSGLFRSVESSEH